MFFCALFFALVEVILEIVGTIGDCKAVAMSCFALVSMESKRGLCVFFGASGEAFCKFREGWDRVGAQPEGCDTGTGWKPALPYKHTIRADRLKAAHQ